MSLDSQLDALASAGLIGMTQQEPEAEYQFRHALVQDVVYASLLARDRQRLHSAAGRALESLYPARLEALSPILAHHFETAGDQERACKYFILAADRALATYANCEAESYYRKALGLTNIVPQQIRLIADLGRALDRQGRYQEAIQSWSKAIHLCRSLGDVNGLARLYARSARAAWYGGDWPRSLTLCREGLAEVAGEPETEGIAALLHETARACYFNGLLDEAHQLCLQALQIAERLGTVEIQAETLATLGILPDCETDQALQALTRAVELSESASLLTAAIRAHNNLGSVLYEKQGDLRAGCKHHLRAMELAHQRGAVSQEILSLLNALDALLFLGDLEAVEQALPALGQLLSVVANHSPGAFGFYITQARLLWHRGELVEAAGILSTCRTEARRCADLHHLNAASRFLAEILVELGELAQAEEVLLEAIEASDKGGGWNSVWPRCLLVAVYAQRGSQHLEAARELLALAREQAGPQPTMFDREKLLLAQARLACSAGCRDEAMAAFEAAADLQARMNLRWYQARTLCEWAAACKEPRAIERAQVLLRQALALFEEMQVAYYVADVKDELRMLDNC